MMKWEGSNLMDRGFIRYDPWAGSSRCPIYADLFFPLPSKRVDELNPEWMKKTCSAVTPCSIQGLLTRSPRSQLPFESPHSRRRLDLFPRKLPLSPSFHTSCMLTYICFSCQQTDSR